jgi:competence protein ComGC
MRFSSKTNRPAFTVIELIVLVGVILLLALVLIPSMGKAHRKADLINCANNLKQVGVSFRLWESDGDRYPMSLSTNHGGTLEVPNEVWRTFLVMSNELDTTKLLCCQSDNRAPANSWTALANSNISYFVCLDADETLPEMLLSGDRNLTTGKPSANCILTVGTNGPLNWTDALHGSCGNLGLSDGSVSQVKTDQLIRQVALGLMSQAEQFGALTTKPPAILRLAMPE